MRSKLNRLLTLGTALICFVSVALANQSKLPAGNKLQTEGMESTSFLEKAKRFFVNGADELAYKYNETKNIMSINNVQGFVGEQVVLPIELENEDNISAMQFDLYLPKGINVALDSRSHYMIKLAEERSDGHVITSRIQNDGAIRVVSYSLDNYPYIGNSGKVVNITLDISSTISDGNYPVSIKNIVLATPDVKRITSPETTANISVQSYKIGDVNNDGYVDVTDVSGIIAFILGNPGQNLIQKAADVNKDGTIDVTDISGALSIILENPSYNNYAQKKNLISNKAIAAAEGANMEILPFTLKANEKKDIKVYLNNNGDNNLCGIQFDLFLPEGITIEKNARGKLMINNCERAEGNVTTAREQNDKGHFRVINFSSENLPYMGTEGEVLTIRLSGAPDLKEGVHEFRMDTMVMSRPDATGARPKGFVASILSGQNVEKDIVLKGHFNKTILDTFSNALAGTEMNSVDFTMAKGIEGELSFNSANPNMVVYLAQGQSLANKNNVVVADRCASLLLTDGHDFNAVKPFVADNATYSRNISTAGWYSVYLPYDANVPAGVTVEQFVSLNAAKASATFEKANEMQANRPYIFKADANTVFAATNVEVQATDTLSNDIFKGTYSLLPAGTVNGKFALRNDGSGFGICTPNASIPAFRTYIDANIIAKSIKINHSDATAIEAVEAEENIFPADIYTVDGKLVKKQAQSLDGLAEGVYIVNGNKIIK